MTSQSQLQERWLRLLWWSLGALLLVRLLGMAWMPLMDTVEGRYGEIGRKMWATGDWITPWHDHGVPFWGKPPLSFWLTALSFRVLGVGEFAARWPHFLCSAMLSVSLWAAVRPEGRITAWMAVALLWSGLLFFLSAGAVMTDAALVLGTTVALCSSWQALTARDSGYGQRWGWMAFLGGACGVLAKGPLALILIGAPLLVWAAWAKRWLRLWRALPWMRGMALVLLLCLPWFYLAERKTPGFLEYFLVGEHVHRFVTPGWTGDLYGNAHREAKGTIWLFTAGALVPWTVLVPGLWFWQRLRRAGAGARVSAPFSADAEHERDLQKFLWVWALSPLAFFSASSNIIWTYALPAMPAVAWWMARYLQRQGLIGLKTVVVGVGLMAVAAVVGGWVADRVGRFERGSAKTLVQECRILRSELQRGPLAEDQPQVVFLGRRSLSADYYTQGRSRRVDHLEQIQHAWMSGGVCVALPVEREGELAAAGLEVVQDLGMRHNRRAFWVRPTVRTP